MSAIGFADSHCAFLHLSRVATLGLSSPAAIVSMRSFEQNGRQPLKKQKILDSHEGKEFGRGEAGQDKDIRQIRIGLLSDAIAAAPRLRTKFSVPNLYCILKKQRLERSMKALKLASWLIVAIGLLSIATSTTSAALADAVPYRASPDTDGIQRVVILGGSYFFRPGEIVVQAGRHAGSSGVMHAMDLDLTSVHADR